MKFEVESAGKNIEQAIDNALFELKCPREDVDIKILDQGGIFRRARVLVSLSADVREKYAEKEKLREATTEEESPSASQNEENVETSQKEQEKVVEKKENAEDVQNNEESAPERVYDGTPSEEGKIAREFIENLLSSLGLSAEIDVTENIDECFVTLTGEGLEALIGYRGDALNALQYLLSIVTSKHNRHAKRMRLDINFYRAKREKTLIDLAERVAAKVQKTGVSAKLEPMSANERRIIHTALQDSTFVTTESKGEEPRRFVIIKLK